MKVSEQNLKGALTARTQAAMVAEVPCNLTPGNSLPQWVFVWIPACVMKRPFYR
jgi:hypothetical protein